MYSHKRKQWLTFKKGSKMKRANITEKTRHQVYAKANYKCLVCGFHNSEGGGLSVDHIIPVAEGGGNNLQNYQCLCMVCNRIKGVNTSTQEFSPPDITDLIYNDGMEIVNTRRLAYRKRFVKKGSSWEDRKIKTLKALDTPEESRHVRTHRMLMRAIEQTFGLKKQLHKQAGYAQKYRKLINKSTVQNSFCVLAYK